MGVEVKTLTAANAAEIAEWCDGILVQEMNSLDHSAISPGINVLCWNGDVRRASVGDVIARRHDGLFHVIKQ